MKKLINRTQLAELAGVSNAAVTKACKNSLKGALVGKLIDYDHEDVQRYLEKHNEGTPPASGIDPIYERAVAFLQTQRKPTVAALAKKFRIGKTRAAPLFKMIKATGILDTIPTIQEQPSPPVTPARVVSGKEKARKTKKSVALESLNNSPDGYCELCGGQTLHEVPENIEAFADMTLRELIQRFGTDTAFVDWLKATKSIEDINEKRIKAAQLRGELVSRDLVKVGVIDPIDAAFTKLLTDVKKTMATRLPAMVRTDAPQDELEDFITDQIGSIIRPTKTKIIRALKNA